MPDPGDENREAVDVYVLCRNQLVFNGQGPIDINFESIEIAMKRLSVVHKNDCFIKVVDLARHFISGANV